MIRRLTPADVARGWYPLECGCCAHVTSARVRVPMEAFRPCPKLLAEGEHMLAADVAALCPADAATDAEARAQLCSGGWHDPPTGRCDDCGTSPETT